MSTHLSATDTFTFTCPWGCTIHVEAGKEKPHTCDGTSRIVDLLRAAPNATVLDHAEYIARGLDPALRERWADVWEFGVQDGRSGEKFYGIDDDVEAAR